ncbi:hypothetical protein V6N11_016886 [Hibiscus sabdariffa]|uniref:Uncharacterized protein n=1 Tax=Hibiscus sabdariffa TaxID=183260 RepID=A0ABR2TWW2_9ROSI
MEGCLAAEVAADRKRNERRLLPVIGAIWARETMPDTRHGVDGWSRLDGSDSTRADASRLQGRVLAMATATGGASGAGETFRTDPDRRRLVWRRLERRRR